MLESEVVMITETQQAALLAAACEAKQLAYAPYSNYPVGAAILAQTTVSSAASM